jgi:NAD(P)H-hydrate epimerase
MCLQNNTSHFRVDDVEQVLRFVEPAGVLVLGPGVGRHPDTKNFVLALLEKYSNPIVLDADVFSLVSLSEMRPFGHRLILTPHPGEAAGLLGVSVAEVQSNRYYAAQKLHELSNSIVVLKGAASIIQGSGQGRVLSFSANPALAIAGSGDVLAGTIAAQIPHHPDLFDATCQGVLRHNRAGFELSEMLNKPFSALDLAKYVGFGIHSSRYAHC